MKRSEVSIKTRSTPASLSFKGQATKHTTLKWSIHLQVYPSCKNAIYASRYLMFTWHSHMKDIPTYIINMLFNTILWMHNEATEMHVCKLSVDLRN